MVQSADLTNPLARKYFLIGQLNDDFNETFEVQSVGRVLWVNSFGTRMITVNKNSDKIFLTSLYPYLLRKIKVKDWSGGTIRKLEVSNDERYLSLLTQEGKFLFTEIGSLASLFEEFDLNKTFTYSWF